MNRFFVGQMVKIVAGDFPELIGTETRIVDVAIGSYVDDGYDWIIDIHGEPWGAANYHLSPILPDGHRAAEESLEELLPFLKEQKVSA